MGDLNTYDPGTVQKTGLNRLLKNGLMQDLWLETSTDDHVHRNDHRTWNKGKKDRRIDYILVDNQLNKDFILQMEIDDSTRSQVVGEQKYFKINNNGEPFTDHSAVILTISEKQNKEKI